MTILKYLGPLPRFFFQVCQSYNAPSIGEAGGTLIFLEKTFHTLNPWIFNPCASMKKMNENKVLFEIAFQFQLQKNSIPFQFHWRLHPLQARSKSASTFLKSRKWSCLLQPLFWPFSHSNWLKVMKGSGENVQASKPWKTLIGKRWFLKWSLKKLIFRVSKWVNCNLKSWVLRETFKPLPPYPNYLLVETKTLFTKISPRPTIFTNLNKFFKCINLLH